jgi:curved DNA-binding protein CbpA
MRKRHISNTYTNKNVDFSRDYYEILGLDGKATSEDIKKAYRELAKKYHPDINKSSTSEELFKLISEAYEVLSDDTRRTQYDLYRKFENEPGIEDAETKKPGPEKSDSPANVSDVPKYRERKPGPATHVPQRDRIQILILSLVVPGYYQIYAGEKNFGFLLFAIYFIFWALAFIQSLPIAILALLVWMFSFFDAYSRTGARK